MRASPPKPKPVHWAFRVNNRGGVMAICFDRPRAIDLIRATWTIRRDAVTCKKCLERMR